MKLTIAVVAAMLLTSIAAAAEEPDNALPIDKLIASVAQKTHRKFVVDPRVEARVHLVGQEPSQVSYDQLLTILAMHGFVTYESSGYVVVIPDANARQVAQPQLSKGQTYPDAQVVNYTIHIENGPAAHLVPLLRPLIPQYGQLAAWPCANTLIITDRYANVKKIEALIKALDAGTPYKPEKCETTAPESKRNDS